MKKQKELESKICFLAYWWSDRKTEWSVSRLVSWNAMLLDVIFSTFETQLCFLFSIQALKFLYEKGIPYGKYLKSNLYIRLQFF